MIIISKNQVIGPRLAKMSQSERKRHIQPSAEQDVGELCHGYHPHMSSLHQQRSDKVHDFVKSFNLAYNKAVKFADPADKMHPGPRMPRMCLDAWRKETTSMLCVILQK